MPGFVRANPTPAVPIVTRKIIQRLSLLIQNAIRPPSSLPHYPISSFPAICKHLKYPSSLHSNFFSKPLFFQFRLSHLFFHYTKINKTIMPALNTNLRLCGRTIKLSKKSRNDFPCINFTKPAAPPGRHIGYRQGPVTHTSTSDFYVCFFFLWS